MARQYIVESIEEAQHHATQWPGAAPTVQGFPHQLDSSPVATIVDFHSELSRFFHREVSHL